MVQTTAAGNLLMLRLAAVAGGVALAGVSCRGVDPAVADRVAAGGYEAGSRPDALVFSWPDGVGGGKPLGEEEAVVTALWNHPGLQMALAELGVSRAEVIRAGQLTNPTLSVFMPSNGRALEVISRLPVEALVLRPGRRRAAMLEAEVTAGKLMQQALDVVRDVRVAWAGIEVADARREVSEESGRLMGELAGLARKRAGAGEMSVLEAEQAEAEAHAVVQEATRLEGEARLARERLRGLLGMNAGGAPLEVRVTEMRRREMPGSEGELVARGLAVRPDVRAAELAVVAAGARAKLARAEILMVAATGHYRGEEGLQPGIDSMSLPLWQRNDGARAAAAAQLEKARRGLNLVREQAAGEIRAARVRVEQARAVHAGWGPVVREMETVLARTRRAVELGDALPSVAVEVARRLNETRGRAAESEGRLREAWAELERATGGRVGA